MRRSALGARRIMGLASTIAFDFIGNALPKRFRVEWGRSRLGRADLIASNKASGRPKDLADLETLKGEG